MKGVCHCEGDVWLRLIVNQHDGYSTHLCHRIMMICLNPLVQIFEGHSLTLFFWVTMWLKFATKKTIGYASFAMNLKLHHIYRNEILQILSFSNKKLGKFWNFLVFQILGGGVTKTIIWKNWVEKYMSMIVAFWWAPCATCWFLVSTFEHVNIVTI
jgi:hypothetical protein